MLKDFALQTFISLKHGDLSPWAHEATDGPSRSLFDSRSISSTNPLNVTLATDSHQALPAETWLTPSSDALYPMVLLIFICVTFYSIIQYRRRLQFEKTQASTQREADKLRNATRIHALENELSHAQDKLSQAQDLSAQILEQQRESSSDNVKAVQLEATLDIAGNLTQRLKETLNENGTEKPNSNNKYPVTPSEVVASLQLLLRDTGSQRGIRRTSLLSILDTVRQSLAPMILEKGSDFIIVNTPRLELELEAEVLTDLIKNLFLQHLCACNQTLVTLELFKEDDHVDIVFSENMQASAITVIDLLPDDLKVSWHGGCLSFPIVSAISTTSTNSHLTAMVLEDHPLKRLNLQNRLAQLGVRCVHEFEDQNIDLCIVSDHTSESFRTVRSLLSSKTVFVYQNSHPPKKLTPDQQHKAFSMDLTTQSKLAHLITQIGRQRSATKVLIVDDSEASQKMLEMQVTQLGLVAESVFSGEQALELLANTTYTHIFMDSQMPGLSGEQTTRLLRGFDSHVVIVGLTAHATDEERARYLKAGMNKVLQKPADLSQLKELLGEPSTAKNPSTNSLSEPNASNDTARNQSTAPNKTAPSSELPIFDPVLSMRNANNRADLAIELLELLIKGLPDDVQGIKQSAWNVTLLSTQVHKLHGAVRYCGVPKLEQSLASLEATIKTDPDKDFLAQIHLVTLEVDHLLVWFKDHKHELAQLVSART